MALLSRDLDGGGIGRNGILVAVGGIGVVLALFFIPEIIEFQKSFSSSDSGREGKRTKIAAETVAQPPAETGDLKDLPADSTSGTIDRLSALLDGGKGRGDVKASLRGTSKKSTQKDIPEVAGQLTWEKIRSKESKDALIKAKGTAAKLAQRVGDDAALSQHALLNFSNGVDYILERGPESLAPRDAARYLDSLSRAVSRSLAQEAVDRKVVTQWSKVSLGPVINTSIKTGINDISVQQFNPQLTLTWLTLRQRSKDGMPDPRGNLRASVGGYVIGDDITSVEVVTPQGAVTRSLNLTRSRRFPEYRFFRFVSVGQKGTILRVRDKHGVVFEKGYDFPAGARRLRFEDRRYVLPFSITSATPRRFALEDVDHRLDGYFTRYVWRGSKQELAARIAQQRFGATEPTGLENSAEGRLFATF